jgi:hypothetical protein
MVYAVADALATRGVPFVFATGYDREAMPERFFQPHPLREAGQARPGRQGAVRVNDEQLVMKPADARKSWRADDKI